MRLHRKHIITALAATALFASLAATAPARNISLTNRNIRVTFNPIIFNNEVARVSCRVTVEGSFHCATISKVDRALIGYISRATIEQETCRSSSFALAGRVRQATLPWHLAYLGFRGRLPEAIEIDLVENAGFEMNNVPLIGTCNYSATADLFVGGPTGGAINEGNASARMNEATRQRSETSGCPEGTFATTTAPITLLGTTTGIRLRLT
jgi:hypothetical protein